MKELISSLEYNNFIIIFIVVLLVIIALIVAVLVDNSSRKKRYKKEIDRVQELIDTKERPIIPIQNQEIDLDVTKNMIAVNNGLINETFGVNSSDESSREEVHEEKVDETEFLPKEDVIETPKEVHKSGDVVYDEHTKTQEEAKRELEEITMKLAQANEEEKIIGHTSFEEEQEELSVISYDELKKINWDTVDETNDILLKDNGDEPITIEELYEKHLEKQDEEEKEDYNPAFEDELNLTQELSFSYNDTSFKNSDFISPVYGILEKKSNQDYTKQDLERTIELDELEEEIRKTEEFLKELKKLKSRLID